MSRLPVLPLFVVFCAVMFTACSPSDASSATPTPTLTLLPTLTSTPDVPPTATEFRVITETPPPTPTTDPSVATVMPVIVTDLEAPLTIELPEDWATASDALLDQEGGGDMPFLPFTIAQGPLSDGTGNIVILWGFRNIIPTVNENAPVTPDSLRGDGVRLLFFIILEQECNIGIDETTREFTIGDLPAFGGFFVAEDCPDDLPDTRGWFAVLREGNLNFAFYAFVEPGTAFGDETEAELQSILDTVVIDLSLLPTPVPTVTATPDVTATP